MQLEEQVLKEVEYAFNRYLTTEQAMKYAGGISRTTLWKWVNKLGLPQIKETGITLYDRKDIDEFLEKHKE